jgi:hypothetical protein
LTSWNRPLAASAKRSLRAITVACAAIAAGAASARAQDRLNQDKSAHTEIRGELPLRSAARVVEADAAGLAPQEMVIGVVVGGQARAYPVNLMWGPEHEVVNDQLGGTAVAASWCPIVLSGEVYAREVDGRRLELGAVGAEDGVLVLYDQATHSRWSQVAGRATSGPLAGSRLRKMPSLVTTWARWRTLHPDTTVYVSEAPGTVRRRFTEETVGMAALGDEGPVRNEDWVVGLEGTSTARPSAFLYRRLVEGRAANETFGGRPIVAFLSADLTTAVVWDRSVDGRALTFTASGDFLEDRETGSRWDPFTGRALLGPLGGRALTRVPSSSALWYAWKAQYPETTVFGGGAP